MGIWNRLFDVWSIYDPSSNEGAIHWAPVNPATGLPMLSDDIGGIDIGGSPFGFDVHEQLSSFNQESWPSNDFLSSLSD